MFNLIYDDMIKGIALSALKLNSRLCRNFAVNSYADFEVGDGVTNLCL